MSIELKKQGFEFAGQSYLFWEFIRILNDVRKTNPDVLFLLENVKMGKKWEPVFDDAIGCKGNHINSALVSAQVRKRIYWTNIQGGIIPQPEDEGLTISDIAEYEVDEKYYLSENAIGRLIKKNNRLIKAGWNAPVVSIRWLRLAAPARSTDRVACIDAGQKYKFCRLCQSVIAFRRI